MKNGLFFTIFLLLAASSFAQDMRHRYLYIEGTAERTEHLNFFKSNFAMEADGCGYIVTNSREEAIHTLQFNVVSANDPDYEQYIISLSLIRNTDNAQLVSFDFVFADLNEVQSFIRTLFLNSVTSIPLPLLTEENLHLARGNHWYKWIYLRASFDYPITFYLLQPVGLKGGIGLFYTDPSKGEETRTAPIGHEIIAMPGATLGAEFHLLNFMSLELDLQLGMGDTRDNSFINMAIATELKFPIKLRNVMLVPYGAFSYALNVSPIFSEFPPFAAGGGIQVCARAGKRGIIFVDAQYMFSFSDAVMHNPYLAFPDEQQLYPEPAIIHYKRSQLGIGIGYKFGIIDRPKKTATIIY
jgi:hypothetical protein